MIIGGLVIAACTYVFGQELKEKQQKKKKALAKRLSPTVVVEEDFSLKHQLKEILSPFVDDERTEQIQEFSTIEKSKEEQEIEDNLSISATALGVSVISSVFFPPAQILAFGGLLWASLPIYKATFEALKERKVNADTMDALAMTGILATGHLIIGSIGSLIYFGSKKLLLKTEDRSTRKLLNLFGEQPKSVWIMVGEVEVEIPFEELEKGNIISLNTGEMIPIDGKVVKGFALIDQQALTGESQPAEKKVGDTCFASTLVLEGYLHVEVEKAGRDTVAAQIGQILNRSIDFKEVMTSKGQEVADKAAPVMLGMIAATVPIMGLMGGAAIANTSFGYILRLVSPMMVLNFLTIASQEGILVKDGRSLELLNKIDTVIFDKTGTLTLPQPHIKKIHVINNLSEEELLTYTAAAEYRQTHPIALAILQAAKERQLDLPEIDEAKYELGYGIKVSIDDKIICVGSARFMKMQGVEIPTTIEILTEYAHNNGYSLVHIAINKVLEGTIELHPTVRPEAKAIIRELQANKKTCYIISGDHERPTRHLAKQLGIDHYFAEVLPEDKADLVMGLQKQKHTVCFIGDGINDAIALKKADVSISIRGASTIATDTAQIVLMTESLNQLPLLFDLGDQFGEHMRTNLMSCILPAAFTVGGVFFLHFGIVAAILSNQASLLLGVGNSIHPMLTYQQAKLLKGKSHNNQATKPKKLNPPKETLQNDELEIIEQNLVEVE